MYLAEIIAETFTLLTWTLSENKQALWIPLRKQLNAGLNKERQVHAGHLHHPVSGASATLGCASSTCQGPVCTAPAPGFSCLRSSSGLIVPGCTLGSDWEAGACPAFAQEWSWSWDTRSWSLSSICWGKAYPGLVQPCPADLLAWPQTCYYGLTGQLGAWLGLVAITAAALPTTLVTAAQPALAQHWLPCRGSLLLACHLEVAPAPAAPTRL